MNNKLKAYIDTLFAEAPKTAAMEELKEEMLQNLLDKFQDLLAEGKTEQEAYDIAIASVGDVSDLIGKVAQPDGGAQNSPNPAAHIRNGLITAAAVMLYVLCFVPYLFVGSGSLATTLMFSMIALATGLLIWDSPKHGRIHGGLIGAAVALYILFPVPAIALRGAVSVTLMFVLLALATGLLVYRHSAVSKQQPGGQNTLRALSIGAMCLSVACMLAFCAFAAQKGASRRINHENHAAVEELDDLDDWIDDDFDRFDDDDSHGNGVHNGAAPVPNAPNNAAQKPDASAQKEKDDKKRQEDPSASAALISAGSGSVPMTGVSEIEIDWVAGSVQVKSGEGTDIVFTETSTGTLSDAQTMRYRVKGNELSISFMESTWSLKDLFSFTDLLGTPAKDLVVTVPAAMITQGQLAKLEINGVSADITLDDAFGGETELKTVSGDIASYRAGGSELSAESTSGEVTLSDFAVRKLDVEVVSSAVHVLGSAKEADFTTVTGDIDATFAEVPAELESESVSGLVSIGLPAGAGDFTATHETTSGDFDCGIPTVRSGNRYVAGTGTARFEFESVSGDVRIQAGN